MNLAEFIRLYPLRAKNIAWFFGAGTSVSAGMPSANDLVWEFKRRIYCSEEGYHLTLFNNLSDPAIRNQIQSYFDSKANYPFFNSTEEYSFYFELAYPSASDCSVYLMDQLKGMQNSFGHKVIGSLIKNDLIKLIFTTNFDKAFENCAIDQLKSLDKFFVASIDNSATAIQKYYSDLRPFIVKMHGDYFSEKLKNTTAELKAQDKQLKEILFHSCISNGLAIMGYSGRDNSVIQEFERALDQELAFPNGIFWFIRSNSDPLLEVKKLLEKAKLKGIQAEFVEIETFDTAWADIVKGFPNLPKADIEKLNINYYKRNTTKLPEKGSQYPFIRFNAIRILEAPTNARLVKCEAGNTKDINEYIKTEKGELIAIRKKAGVVGFGADSEFERIFSIYGKLEKDVFPIPGATLGYDDSTLKGLLTEGLLMAIARNKPLVYRKRREKYLLFPDPKKISENIFTNLNKEMNYQLNGVIPNTSIQWIIGVEILLQKKLSNYYLVISPTVIAAKTTNDNERVQIAPFVKEAMARWYNIKYSRILDLWIDIIFLGKKETDVFLFDENIKGYNAKYKMIRDSPFTKSV